MLKISVYYRERDDSIDWLFSWKFIREVKVNIINLNHEYIKIKWVVKPLKIEEF